MRKYLDKNKTAIIYKVIDKDEMKYIGSTDSRFRLNFHQNGYSKLDLKNNPGEILYAEIDEIDREELYFIEYYLISKYSPYENIEKPSLDKFKINKNRKMELIKIADNLEFNVF